ncbi:hypothetical protein [Streptomyces rhizosphaerihabitans]|uniref:hypothetical protein n=1 Tax=Streptomyces rhizosphaerihabitans TaxID=1266770 RepID=UPI0021C13278|nr:hypothetical protein [Streptomyces rhizosphaerihabitans]MCT9011113.1 hypothetical protein [Streptomyces rhizosphaerihabitans]
MDAVSLPMTPKAQDLGRRDASDVPVLLAGVITPAVIIGTDADLVLQVQVALGERVAGDIGLGGQGNDGQGAVRAFWGADLDFDRLLGHRGGMRAPAG